MPTKTKNTTKAATKPAKNATMAKPAAEAGEKKISALDAAARVLNEKGVAMTCQELIGTMAAKGYWSSPGGQTPAATLASAILREITTKGADSRFAKTAPGRFAAKDAPVVAITTAPLPAKKAGVKKAAKHSTEINPATPLESGSTPAV